MRHGLHTLALLTLVSFTWAQEEKPKAYDPFEGMDKDGKIDRPEIPADIKNPDRWRYTCLLYTSPSPRDS